MPFGSRTRVGSRNHVLDEGPDLHKLLWCLWWFSVIRPSQHHCWSLQGPQSTYSKPVQVNHPPAFILPSSTTWTVGCWALPLTTVKPQLQQRCFSKHKPHAGHRNWPWPSNSSKRGTKHVFPVNLSHICSPVPDTSDENLVFVPDDLDLQIRPSEGPNTSSLWISRKSIQWFRGYFIHKQKSHSDKNRTLRSSLHAVTTLCLACCDATSTTYC